MKWFVGVLLLLNVGLYLWATGHKNTQVAATRPVVNAAGMRLLLEQPASPDVASTRVCYRIGPFIEELGSAAAQERLQAMSVPYKALKVNKREVRAYRVFLGPYGSPAEIEAQRGLLRKNGVNEHYVKSEPGGEDVISLGLFSQQARADEFREELSTKSIQAKTRPENRILGPTFWLELRGIEPKPAVMTALRESRWQDDKARLRVFPCS